MAPIEITAPIPIINPKLEEGGYFCDLGFYLY